MTERVDELAAFLVRDGHRMDAHELKRTIATNWPLITADEMERAFAIVAETKQDDAAEDLPRPKL